MNSQLSLDSIKITAGKIQKTRDGLILTGSAESLGLTFQPRRFYRHGWQSWSLAAWIDPSVPPVPISSPEFRMKDEDPVYTSADRHVSAWLGAVERPDGQVLLLGGLGLGARVELRGNSLCGFYETGSGEWFVGIGAESQVFPKYTKLLGERFGRRRVGKAPRVWCSWYSLYNLINEKVMLDVLDKLGDLPFDVVQLDDGWQIGAGDWEANKKFPSGMAAMADKIRLTGRTPGIWLAPLMVKHNSSLFHDHPDWVLRDEQDNPISVGPNWSGRTYALDTTHPAVLDWLDGLVRKARGWGYGYLKLDFLYAGAFPGKHYKTMPREQAYRQALKVMREAAGDAYLLTCAAPVIPSLGLCDGMRIGPDVTPYWLNTPMSAWLNNPNHPSTQNAIRTSLHRLWLNPLVHTDPDVVFFRSRHNGLKPEQKSLLRDLGLISSFKATSDLPQWLKPGEKEELRRFLEAEPKIECLGRYRFCIDGREVDYVTSVPLPDPVRVPASLGIILGLYDMAIYEVAPAIFAVKYNKKR